LDVIGAGLGRTGTLSLKLALEQLGFAPCYHMLEVRPVPERVLVFDAKQAWAPLCAFLAVQVPDAPFPSVNISEQFRTMLGIAES